MILFKDRGMARARSRADAVRIAQDNMDAQNFYGWNPAFDRKMESRK